MRRIRKGGYRPTRTRLWLTGVTLLLGLSSLLAQPHIIDASRELKVSDFKRDYGSLHFATTLLGGRKIDATTYDFAGKNEARLRLSIRVVGRNNRWKRQMYVGIAEKSFRLLNANHWQLASRPETILLKTDDGEQVLEFVCTKPGIYNVVLPYVFLDMDESNLIDTDTWPIPPVENVIITTNVSILNLPTAADREWEAVKISGSVPRILDFVLSNPGKTKQGAALPIIEPLLDADGKKYIFQTTDPARFQAFINKYGKYENQGFPKINALLHSARISLAGPTEEPTPEKPVVVPDSKIPTKETEAATAWANAVAQRDTQLLNDYLVKYPNVIPANDLVAADSLSCWSPAGFKPLKRKNNREQIQLTNFITPAYYDVYDGRLTIDDDLLVSSKLLSIEVQRTGKFNLVIVDKGCPRKQLEIPLDNLMSAAVTVDTILGEYTFTFDGGKQPYALQLTPEDGMGKGFLWQKIQERTLVLSQDSLQREGLEGKYLASAYSGDSNNPVAVAGPIVDVPARPWPSWILPFLIVLAIGAMALLLLFILRRGKPQQRTIFEEA